MAGALAARWLLTAVFAAAGLGSRPVPGRPVPGRVGTARAAARVSVLFHALMCAAARPGVRELGVEAGGLMARAFVALREKMCSPMARSWRPRSICLASS